MIPMTGQKKPATKQTAYSWKRLDIKNTKSVGNDRKRFPRPCSHASCNKRSKYSQLRNAIFPGKDCRTHFLSWSSRLFVYLVDISVQKILNWCVPCAVVFTHWTAVPPVLKYKAVFKHWGNYCKIQYHFKNNGGSKPYRNICHQTLGAQQKYSGLSVARLAIQ